MIVVWLFLTILWVCLKFVIVVFTYHTHLLFFSYIRRILLILSPRFWTVLNVIVSSKIYDKRDDFHFEIVNVPFLNGDVPRSHSYGVYISQLIRFARVCAGVEDFNNRNQFLTTKLFKQCYRYHKIRKAIYKFYHRHSEFIGEHSIGLKILLQQGISEPIFYGDLVYKFKRFVGNLILLIDSKRLSNII